MTYFGFLALFLGLPIVYFGARYVLDRRRGLALPPVWPIAVLCAVALAYTTPWDNYLVATGVWYYNPDLVTGIVFGWVPIEEYTFFLLQPIMVGLWLAFWLGRSTAPQPAADAAGNGRRTAAALVGLVWLASAGILASGWEPGTYLGLELAWALPPVILQLAYGGDILRDYRKFLWLGIAVPTLYLSAADRLAIGWGTWTIDPAQSTGLLLLGLPVEEFFFFLLTNTLVTLGLILSWAPASRERLANLLERFRRNAAPESR